MLRGSYTTDINCSNLITSRSHDYKWMEHSESLHQHLQFSILYMSATCRRLKLLSNDVMSHGPYMLHYPICFSFSLQHKFDVIQMCIPRALLSILLFSQELLSRVSFSRSSNLVPHRPKTRTSYTVVMHQHQQSYWLNPILIINLIPTIGYLTFVFIDPRK